MPIRHLPAPQQPQGAAGCPGTSPVTRCPQGRALQGPLRWGVSPQSPQPSLKSPPWAPKAIWQVCAEVSGPFPAVSSSRAVGSPPASPGSHQLWEGQRALGAPWAAPAAHYSRTLGAPGAHTPWEAKMIPRYCISARNKIQQGCKESTGHEVHPSPSTGGFHCASGLPFVLGCTSAKAGWDIIGYNLI